MDRSAFRALAGRYLKGVATPGEKRLLLEYYRRLLKAGKAGEGLEQPELLKDQMFQNIQKVLKEDELAAVPAIRIRPRRWYAYGAAACVLLISAVALLFMPTGDIPASQEKTLKSNGLHTDIGPGGNKAVLTLADGRRISLDNMDKGQIANEAGVIIKKTADGHLEYTLASPQGGASAAAFNTIETPRGGQYVINLPDGSRVWLNAASSLKFPARFAGAERKVELLGEGYFEIARNELMPFKVQTGSQTIEVLGTHFNVNSYANEQNITTTLLEGSVKVHGGGAGTTRLLKPGQAAVNRNGLIKVDEANIEQAVSWRNGNFIFNDADLETILKQLERWYDLDVDYSFVPKTRFSVHISRNLGLSDVLRTLEVTGDINFEVEGKKIKIIHP